MTGSCMPGCKPSLLHPGTIYHDLSCPVYVAEMAERGHTPPEPTKTKPAGCTCGPCPIHGGTGHG